MGNKFLKVAYAVFMAAVAVAVVVFMIIHLKAGDGGQYSKLITGGYILLLIWALYRCYNIIKSIRR